MILHKKYQQSNYYHKEIVSNSKVPDIIIILKINYVDNNYSSRTLAVLGKCSIWPGFWYKRKRKTQVNSSIQTSIIIMTLVNLNNLKENY